MKFPNLLRFLTLLPILFIFMACGEVSPIWKGEEALSEEGYTLYFSEPCEFEIDLRSLEGPLDTRLELSITYYVKIARTSLPLTLDFEDLDHNRREFNTEVLIKDEGEWLGRPVEDGVDYTITHTAIERLPMNNTLYSLKIYSNDEDFEPIEGIVKVSARLYELEEDKEKAT